MMTYKLRYCTVNVIDCSNEAVDFRICEVFNIQGKKIHEIRTTKKGKYAAELAQADALHWRII